MALTRRLILQKARHHRNKPALTVCRRTVSGTVSLPSRGTFHLSLTVLVRYRSSGSIQAYQVVLTDSHGIPRAPCYSGTPPGLRQAFRLRDSHPLRPAVQDRSPTPPQHPRPPADSRKEGPTTPCAQPLPGITRAQFGLIRVRSPLLTESLLFSLPAGTEMFHFPAFPPHRLCVQRRVTASSAAGFPHSDTLGSQSGYRLPQAYRRFPRPSSAPDAKASTVRPWKLQHNKDQGHTTTRAQQPVRVRPTTRKTRLLDARVHYTVLKQQPPQPPHTAAQGGRDRGRQAPHTPHTRPAPPATEGQERTRKEEGGAGTRLLSQDPTVCQGPHPHREPGPALSRPPGGAYSHRTGPHGAQATNPADVPPTSTRRRTHVSAAGLPSPRHRHAMRPPAPPRGVQCSLERR